MIYHSVNSGLYFSNGTNGLLIDGLHNGLKEGFSKTPSSMWTDLTARNGWFQGHTDLLFTHHHPDHYDRDLVASFTSQSPQSSVYVPSTYARHCQVSHVTPHVRSIQLQGFQVQGFTSSHEGALYRQTPHLVYLIAHQGQHYLVTGDAILDTALSCRLAPYLPPQLHAIFVNPYQMRQPTKDAFFSQLSFQNLYLCHLPYPQDDRYRFCAMAQQVIARNRTIYPQLKQLSPMSIVKAPSPIAVQQM